jgi:hypothetical protein
MQEINWVVVVLSGLVPTLVGFLWYGPVFGKAWMQESGMTKEKAQGMNMAKVMGLAILMSMFAAGALLPIVIHQMGVFSVLQGVTGGEDIAKNFLKDYSTNFRTFKHGALHGTITGLLIALPVTAMASLWERKSFKYVALNAGYWIVTLAIMGGIICQWA